MPFKVGQKVRVIKFPISYGLVGKIGTILRCNDRDGEPGSPGCTVEFRVDETLYCFFDEIELVPPTIQEMWGK